MTGINWTDVTWNPVRGCSPVSEGCRHCYAKQMAARIVRMGKGRPTPYDGLVKMVGGEARWTGKVVFDASKLADPLRWRKPRRVFVNSMSDLFHESLSNEQIAAVFGVMAAAPQHTFQVLTKRSRRMREWFEWAAVHGDGQDMMRFGPSALLTCAWEACSGDVWGDVEPSGVLESIPSADVFGTAWPLPNVWLGVSVENQDAADERIPDLLATPAAVRWLSCEPLLGPVNLHGTLWRQSADGINWRTGEPAAIEYESRKMLHWVVCGCESGPGARPCESAWLRSLRDQCAEAKVPFWLKQATEEGTWVGDNEWEQTVLFSRGSKRKPGGIIDLPYLDGVQHAEFP